MGHVGHRAALEWRCAVVGATAAIACALALLADPAPVRADPAAEARFHDELGRQHYAARRYEAALREFFAQQRLAPNGRILFNIALCFDRLRRGDQAFLFFAEHLGSEDDDPERRRFAEEAVRRLEPTLALVEVSSDPPGATIYVDRREAGSYGTTPRVLPVSAGTRRIELALEGHAPVLIEIEARVGQRAAVPARLERILGRLELAGPEGAHAQVLDAAGAMVHEGATPFVAALPPGDYVLEVIAPGHEAWRGLARVAAEERTQITAEPSPNPAPTSELAVTSSSAGALVDLDGETVGFAPTVLSTLSLGTHRVRVEQPGLVPWEGDVEITETERTWLTVTLEPPPRTDRSPVTWVLGGIGAAALVGAAITGGFAVDAHSQWLAMPNASIRTGGEALAITTDVLLVTGALALGAAVILWFATEYVDARSSRGTVSRVER